ncbi:hypothetical protein RGQ15_04010 [Paracoccus sp. MBLB3053]|uniref:Uncharacterized protein n=1 Tax=Paracoccus aurantius TaxID=3073814 RepID=A0ABU2HNY8_9RHOB|nr:hypothetical protein [Paracoccus sp. MBLB3053]MDS9466747.1 hypothetical protein [Paracoccus sp. MBLB3053]
MSTKGLLLSAAQSLPGFMRSSVNKLLLRRLQCDYSLSPEEFRNKKILIIGPARTVEDDLIEIDPTHYDLVVKMNNGLDTPVACKGLDPMRCDILFHCLTKDARPVTQPKLEKAKVELIVHRTPKRSGFLNTLVAAQNFASCRVRNIPCTSYEELSAKLGGASPSTGLVCAQFFLRSPADEVAIAGFTFSTTAYQCGYDDAVTSDKAAICRIERKGHHAPRLEAGLLADLVEAERKSGKVVVLGRNMILAMRQHGAI